jgi:hypothetical protein
LNLYEEITDDEAPDPEEAEFKDLLKIVMTEKSDKVPTKFKS